MKVIGSSGCEDLAIVTIAETAGGKVVEFVEALQPPLRRQEKWVLIVSTLSGCPVGCSFCDAGSHYKGKLTREEILAQIDALVEGRYPDRRVDAEKFKIQFARMGEPSLNLHVLDVLEELPSRYDAPGLMPCLSTIAPRKTDRFFERLLEIKKRHYPNRFQLQFSIHTTDDAARDRLMPMPKWTFPEMAKYGERFFDRRGRKIALNFAVEKSSKVEASVLATHFDPEVFIVKITPLNPTYSAARNGQISHIDPCSPSSANQLVEEIKAEGYEVLLSIGEVDENQIGSNCGQLVLEHRAAETSIEGAYALAGRERSAKVMNSAASPGPSRIPPR